MTSDHGGKQVGHPPPAPGSPDYFSPCELRVSWLAGPLWLVATEADVGDLLAEGVSRGRIWTTAELVDLLKIPSLTQAGARAIACAKLEFDGDVVEVRDA